MTGTTGTTGTGGSAPAPGAPGTPDEAAPAGPSRRPPRAAARWAAAALVFAVLGSGVAYGVTLPDRTDLPGLATGSDGRWDYPRLELPPLPSGSPRPFGRGNPARIHHADPRDLLLPAPEGAREDKALPGIEGGWVSRKEYLSLYEETSAALLGQRLRDEAAGRIAARGWRMPDGTRTQIYLLRFPTANYAKDFGTENLTLDGIPSAPLRSAPGSTAAGSWPEAVRVPHVSRYEYDENAPRGREHTRQAYLVAGDTIGVVVQSRPGTARELPFRQTVILQSQLLG